MGLKCSSGGTRPTRQSDPLYPTFLDTADPFLRDGRLALSNNATERAIKSVVIGRKAWLFSAAPAGVRTLANLYA
jgi:hypothetical protein